MEPNLVAYSPILHRPPLRWPDGARVALWWCRGIEHYEYLPKYVRTRIPGRASRSRHPRLRARRLWQPSDCGGCSMSPTPGHPLHRQPQYGGA